MRYSRNTWLAALAAYVVCVALMAGCGSQASVTRDGDAQKAVSDRVAPGASGKLVVDVRRQEPASLRKVLTQADVEKVVDVINRRVELPEDVRIVLGGAKDGPYYDSESSEIQYPWSFVAEARQLLEKAGSYEDSGRDGAELNAATKDAALFILQHEIAHAIIDKRKLPVLGREEDAADTFASYVAVNFLNSPEQVVGASDLFGAYDSAAESDTFEEAEFFDSHSLDAQRFYAISCQVYGSNPNANRDLVAGLQIDRERLDECEAEWQQIDSSWRKLLTRSMR